MMKRKTINTLINLVENEVRELTRELDVLPHAEYKIKNEIAELEAILDELGGMKESKLCPDCGGDGGEWSSTMQTAVLCQSCDGSGVKRAKGKENVR